VSQYRSCKLRGGTDVLQTNSKGRVNGLSHTMTKRAEKMERDRVKLIMRSRFNKSTHPDVAAKRQMRQAPLNIGCPC
jgi:hypothetical protein